MSGVIPGSRSRQRGRDEGTVGRPGRLGSPLPGTELVELSALLPGNVACAWWRASGTRVVSLDNSSPPRQGPLVADDAYYAGTTATCSTARGGDDA